MNVLIIGGTGLISTGIVKHLLTRNANITMLNRGNRRLAAPLAGRVQSIKCDRNDFSAFEHICRDQTFDVVIDMICFKPDQADSDIRAFSERCGHFIFCSTVCTYGVKVPPNVLVNETFPQEPISDYGQNKLACEQIFLRAHEKRRLNVTLIRPSHTYGPGLPLIDNIETDPVAWDRIERGMPVLCAGDGLGLWVSTHRDDCGRLFAHAALNPKTFGQSYNATRDQILTWREYLKQIAAVIGKPINVIFMPAGWIIRHDPQRFKLLKEITQFHGAYDSSKAKQHVPQFKCEIDLHKGVSETFQFMRQQKTWRASSDDPTYETMVQEALGVGIEPQTL